MQNQSERQTIYREDLPGCKKLFSPTSTPNVKRLIILVLFIIAAIIGAIFAIWWFFIRKKSYGPLIYLLIVYGFFERLAWSHRYYRCAEDKVQSRTHDEDG